MGWGLSQRLSCSTAPARDRAGQGAAWADPALSISHLPGASGGQGWDRNLGILGPPSPASKGMDQLRLPCLKASPGLAARAPEGDAPRALTALSETGKDSWECISFAERRRKSPFDAWVIFALVIHAISKEE